MSIKITVDVADEGGIRRLGTATLVNIDNGSLAVPDYAVHATETAHPLTGAPAWERRGLLPAIRSRQSVWRLVEIAARWAGDEAEKPQ